MPPNTPHFASRIARLLALCTLLLAPAFGCGGCKKDGAGNGYDVPSGAFGNVLSTLCDTIERCPNAFGSPIAYRSNKECAAILNFVLTCRVTETEINDDESIYGVKKIEPDVDDARARGCMDWIDGASCNEIRGFEEGGPCDGVFTFDDDDDDDDDEVPGALDEPCSYDDPCEPQLYCAGGGTDEDAGITYCQICRPRFAIGKDCQGDQCVSGAYCKPNEDMTVFVCAPIEEDGFRCYYDEQCKSGWCNQTLDEGGGWGKCDPGGAVGDDCDQPGACREGLFCAEDDTCQERRPNGGACSPDSYACYHGNCDPETNICGKPDGAACSYEEECASSPCIASVCGGGGEGACVYDTHCPDGEYCNGGCAPGSCSCSGDGCPVGVCTPEGQGGGGGSCEDNDECASGDCENGFCVEGAAIGDACSETYSCYPYQCVNGACAQKAGPGEECGAIDSCQEPFLCIDGRCEMMNLTCAPASAGQRCAWLRVCDESSWCDLLDQVTCKPRARLGEACESSPIRGTETCMPGSTCAYDEASQANRCIKVGAEGEPCVQGKCTQGTFCWEGNCQTGPVGGGCDEYDDSAPPCPDGLYCNDSTCVPQGDIGGACDDQRECIDGLYCENYDTCALRKGQNEECNDTYECQSDLFCTRDSWTCVPRLGEGLACQSHEQHCAEGLYCDGSACAPVKPAGGDCSENFECESNACYSRSFCLSDPECVTPPE